MRPHGRQSYMQWLSYTTVEGFLTQFKEYISEAGSQLALRQHLTIPYKEIVHELTYQGLQLLASEREGELAKCNSKIIVAKLILTWTCKTLVLLLLLRQHLDV